VRQKINTLQLSYITMMSKNIQYNCNRKIFLVAISAAVLIGSRSWQSACPAFYGSRFG
jgi:hypothetical protein